MTEKDRIEFVENRDGKEGALKFVEQTLFLYIKDSMEKYIYKSSIDALKEYLKENGKELVFLIADLDEDDIFFSLNKEE